MGKSKEDLLKSRKDSRKKNADSNKELKSRKNWYPVTTTKQHFIRKSKEKPQSKLRKDLEEGQIVILLSGRFRGKRVVYLKRLESGLLLVTGPYKYNGVPLKRVNAAYVIPTKTKINVKGVADKINEKEFFKKVDVKRESEKDFFEENEVKKGRITNERKDAQNSVDTAVKKAVDAVPELKNYLKFRFALKNGDKPHLMKF